MVEPFYWIIFNILFFAFFGLLHIVCACRNDHMYILTVDIVIYFEIFTSNEENRKNEKCLADVKRSLKHAYVRCQITFCIFVITKTLLVSIQLNVSAFFLIFSPSFQFKRVQKKGNLLITIIWKLETHVVLKRERLWTTSIIYTHDPHFYYFLFGDQLFIESKWTKK